MNDPSNDKRVTRSPEWLNLGGRTYNQDSGHATTFMFIGKVVAMSPRPHVFISNGVRGMTSARDIAEAELYSVTFSSPPDEEDLAAFKASWVGAFGAVRVRNKAGRIWKDVPDGKGGTCSVISFWGERGSIGEGDLDLLMTVFGVEGRVLVEGIDSPGPEHRVAPGGRG